MYNPEPAAAKHRLLEKDDRLKPARPPLPTTHSTPASLYSGDTAIGGSIIGSNSIGSSSSSSNHNINSSGIGSVAVGGVGGGGAGKIVRRMTRTRSSPTPLQHDVAEEDEDRRDSHDLSISPRAFGRESLVDNLLLSFDKFGNGDLGFDSSFFNPTSERADDDSATASSQKTGYSVRGRRSNSSSNHNHIAQLGRLPTHGSGPSRPFGSVDYGSVPGSGGGGGHTSSSYIGRETYSRGGLASAGQLSGFSSVDYDSAPTPTIHSGPRDRSVTIESIPKIERRGSIKSTRSSRKDHHHQQYHHHHHNDAMVLPPLPAFHTPSTVPSTPAKHTKTPGFFRRVFGGGSSSSSSNSGGGSGGGGSGGGASSGSKAAAAAPSVEPSPKEKSLPSPPQQQSEPATGPPTGATINKKPSFFRRRKKSLSDAGTQPAAPLPVQQLPSADYQLDAAEPSPGASLRTAMGPYLRGSIIMPRGDPIDLDIDAPYPPRNATIRPVQSSESGSPHRPTFYGDSRARRDSETHFAYSSSPNLPKSGSRYSKDSKMSKGHASELTLSSASKKSYRDDRPQTSPNTPPLNALPVQDDFADLIWPPSILNTRRSMDTLAVVEDKSPRGTRESESPARKLSEGRRASDIEKPIATVRDIEAQHAKIEEKRRESRGTPLNVDVNVDGFRDTAQIGSSWLATPTPLSAGSSITTPTVLLQVDVGDEKDEDAATIDFDELLGEDEATESEKIFVKKIFDGDEEFVRKARAAAWLGSTTPAAERARRAYMALFDWSNMNILSAGRMLCGKLVLKGETQQVDRIVDAVSKRWCECNPNHGFKNADVIHTILYSLLLLNTDLHMADVPNSQRMTRSQFIKNTMAAITRQLADTPGTPLEARPAHHTLSQRASTLFTPQQESSVGGTVSSGTFPLANKEKKPEPRTSLDFGRNNRHSVRPGFGNGSPRMADDGTFDYEMDGGLALVNNSIAGGMRVWETQMEIILKDFYASVKACALPLHGASKEKIEDHQSTSLSVFGSGVLRRSPSTISKAASENGSRRNDSSGRLNTKWTAKNRSRPKLYNGSYAGSSRTSLEDRSVWSPSASSTWSKYSLDKTQTSMSVTSLGSTFGHHDYQQSIGFANALSHAIIREEASGTTADEASSAHLEDDGMELAGAPWAKEGMIKHKHHLEAIEKKAKNRGWTECFAVIEKGNLKMFLFNTEKTQNNSGVVGGGNWTESAQPIGSFLLRQTIASALPSPGYSKSRPHVWALSLPNGAVHLFQGGTPEIVKEWVSTANYWSARLSKEPLIGGVSNVEYGWGACIADIEALGSGPPVVGTVGQGHGPRPSLQESIRSSIDHGTMVRARLPGDKLNIAEWTPPGQSMMASPLNEADQLKALETYVANIDIELQRHNDLRSAMNLAFSPRHPNYSKAMSNWEKKSSYLLREIVKFRTYIDSLAAAAALREKLRVEERERERERGAVIEE